MPWFVAVVALALRLAVPAVGATEPVEQTITPLVPPVEQGVEALPPGGEQRVESVDLADAQRVMHNTPTKQGLAGKAGKVLVGVLAAAISLGAMAAALLFL